MTDIWFIFGSLAMDPDLLKEIENVDPSFQRIGMITQEVVPVSPDKDPDVHWVTNPAAGYLDEGDTTRVRQVLRDKFAKPYGDQAPIISLYPAGKICQLWNTAEGGLRRSVKGFHACYSKACVAAPLNNRPSVRLLVAMGACILDSQLCALFQAYAPGQGDDVVQEFGFAPQSLGADPEWAALQAFATHTMDPEDTSRTELFSSSAWDCGCLEYFIFYFSFKRAAN